MNQSPAQQWSALSSLYEKADALEPAALAVWLQQLAREANPLLPQLQRMLEARAQFETNDFLGTLPKLAAADLQHGADWAEGKHVGPYRLLRPLGEGGMAEVWLAERDDGTLKRRVAIKLPYPRPGRETFAIRFDRERDILATLRHPNIAGLYDAGVTAEGQAWLALEYVDGQPLADWCDTQRLGLRERVTLFRQVLLAVQHAHANLVIHRDLKPANILVTAQGEVRLLDFGIAKLLEAEGDAMPETELTRQAGRALTPRYASPEQLIGLPLTTACDVYSLGVVFYELICGERPYELKVESTAQLEHAILEIEPRAPSRRSFGTKQADARASSLKALRKALAPELDAIALRCLAKQPTARYSSVDALLADVDRWLSGDAVLARAPGAWYRFGKFAARHRLGVSLGAGAVLSLVAVAAVAVVLGLQAREESARAIAARDFMLNIFKRADQEKSRGADITARDLLETGRKDVLTRLAGQPKLQAELLEGIGTVQKDMGEFQSAADTFAEVASVYEQLRLPRQAALAYAAEANAAMRMGELKRASTLLARARAVPARPVQDAELNARLTLIEGWIASMQGEAEHAKTAFSESRRLALATFGPDHAQSMDALRGLIYAERHLRNYDVAIAQQDELERVAIRVVGQDPNEWAALDEGRVELLYVAGRFAEGMSTATAALARCEKALLPNNAYCRRLRLDRMRLALVLGSSESLASDQAFVDSLSLDASALDIQIDALARLLRLESQRGPSARQRELFKRVLAVAQPGPGAQIDPTLKFFAMLALAESSLRVGAADDAQHWIDQANELRRQSGAAVYAPIIAFSTLLTGIVQLHHDQTNLALASLRRAHDEVSEALGPEHAVARLFSLDVAIALDATGQTDAALKLADEAGPTLSRSLGAGSTTYLRFQRLEDKLRRRREAMPASAGAAPAAATQSDRSTPIEFFS